MFSGEEANKRRTPASATIGNTSMPPMQARSEKIDDVGTYVSPGPVPLTISLTAPSQGISPPARPTSQFSWTGPNNAPSSVRSPDDPFTAFGP